MQHSYNLNANFFCSHNSYSNLSNINISMVKASAMRNVILRNLFGEQIANPGEEALSIIYSKGQSFENIEQMIDYIDDVNKKNAAFQHFITENIHQHDELLKPSDFENLTVDFFGKEIQCDFDFAIKSSNDIRFYRIHTSKDPNKTDYEAYSYLKFGEQLDSDLKIYANKVYLGEPLTRDNLLEARKSVNIYKNDSETKEFYEKQYQIDMSAGCSKENCITCSRQVICNYEEPPVPSEVPEALKTLEGVRFSHAQNEVIDFRRGIACVNAGAGAGKTLTVAARVVAMLKDGIPIEQIMLSTFTTAGAEEMTARIMAYAAEQGIAIDQDKFTSCTINAFCQKLITDNYEKLNYTAPPRIVPAEINYAIINDLINRYPRISGWSYTMNYNAMKYNPWLKPAYKKALVMFEEMSKTGLFESGMEIPTNEWNHWAEFTGVPCPTSLINLKPYEFSNAVNMYREYKQIMKSRNLITFNDQLPLVMELAGDDSTFFNELGYKHIIIDEYQDNNKEQTKFFQKMIDVENFGSLVCVGDDSQSIYGFRGSSPEFIINFDSYFGTNTKHINLVENHRSQKNIIDFANNINDLAYNKVNKALIPTKNPETPVQVQGYYTHNQEMEEVAKKIKEKWDAGETSIAFLAATRNELTSLAAELGKLGIPSVLRSNIKFVDNPRVNALNSFYKSFFFHSTQGLADYYNAITHGSLKEADNFAMEAAITTIRNRIEEKSKSLKTFKEFANELDPDKRDKVYQTFLENLEFCQDINELKEFFDAFEKYGLDSECQREANFAGVQLSTIHGAKGLEWDNVFVSLSKINKNPVQQKAYDEDIRLLFVASSRAKKDMFISGEYISKTDKTGFIFNKHLTKAYSIIEKPLDYTAGEMFKRKEYEKERDSNLSKNLYREASNVKEPEKNETIELA